MLEVPGLAGDTVKLEMTRVNILASDFRVVTSRSPERAAVVEKGLHFWGVVQGVPGSLAAVSVFRNEVMGIYRTPSLGTVVMGRLEGENPQGDHVVYAEKDLIGQNPFTCGATGAAGDFGPALPGAPLPLSGALAASSAVRIYFETTPSIYKQKKTVAAVQSFVMGLFNQSALLYQNASVPITMSEIFVWQTPSPYDNLGTSQEYLEKFQGNRTSFNGDLGHLLALDANVGGWADSSFHGLCTAVRSQSQCFSGLQSDFPSLPSGSTVPLYSYDVEIITHEMGHLMGSRHTHACVWNGNNTAIDGCAAVEGTCAQPPLPPAGSGTIMSYCYAPTTYNPNPPVGVDFSLGFGPQPGAVILSNYLSCYGTVTPLAIVQQPISQVLRVGTSAAFSVKAANGAPPYIYRWQSSASSTGPFADVVAGGAFSGVTTPVLVVNPVSDTNGGFYRCRVGDSSSPAQQVFSNPARLTAITALAVTQQPASASAAQASSASFSVAAAGVAPLTFQWQSSATASGRYSDLTNVNGITGAGTATLTFNPVATGHAGYYRCRITDAGPAPNQVFSNAALLSVTAAVPGYQGCYTDAATRALPIQLGSAQTIESCKQAAFNAGYRYAGVQYYGECFAGNALGYALVSDSECNTPCTANPAEMCGGAWRNSIYDTGYTPPVAPAAPWGLTASYDAASHTVRLAWSDNSTNEQGFEVQVAYAGGAFLDLSPPTVGPNVTTYTSGQISIYGSYQFRVLAFAGGLTSAWSNVASLFVTPASASIAWIQPAESAWGPAGTLTAAGFASNGGGTVQLVFRELADNGVWGAWQTVAYQAAVSADGTWSNTISSGNPTNKCHHFDAYVSYSGVTSPVFQYTGWTGCP